MYIAFRYSGAYQTYNRHQRVLFSTVWYKKILSRFVDHPPAVAAVTFASTAVATATAVAATTAVAVATDDQ